MFARVVLWLVGAVYLLLGIWCSVAPVTTSRSLGYELTTPSAMSEYIVVYGGLEIGLAIAFGLGAAVARWTGPIALVAAVLSTSLAVTRLTTLLTLSGISSVVWILFAVECTLAALTGAAAWRSLRVPPPPVAANTTDSAAA